MATLIGGVITAAGIMGAAWNVTRQMRLAARGREQDRIERVLPGLRGAFSFTHRFGFVVAGKPNAKRILGEFRAIEALTVIGPDFATLIEKLIPTTPDYTRREVIYALFKLRTMAERLEKRELAHANEKQAYESAELDRRDLKEFKLRIEEAERGRSVATENLDDAIDKFVKFREFLLEKIGAERKRGDFLRSEHDRFLDF
jgi:hypothetical protein